MKKPDFKKLAENEYTREYDYLEREAFVKGCELVWKMLEDEVAYYGIVKRSRNVAACL